MSIEMMSSADETSVANFSRGGLGSEIVKTWILVFLSASFALYAVKPSAELSLIAAGLLTFLMATSAHVSVHEGDDASEVKRKHALIGLVGPVQFSLLMWLSVYGGRELAGASLGLSSLLAFAFLVMIIAGDAILSALVLLMNGRGTPGAAFACLIDKKYAGLAGSLDTDDQAPG